MRDLLAHLKRIEAPIDKPVVIMTTAIQDLPYIVLLVKDAQELEFAELDIMTDSLLEALELGGFDYPRVIVEFEREDAVHSEETCTPYGLMPSLAAVAA